MGELLDYIPLIKKAIFDRLAEDSNKICKRMVDKKIRILIAKPGLDGHDRGAKIICRALRDAGFEVIYTGLRRTPEEIVSTAVHEDVDVIGLSLLSGAHNVLFPKILKMLKECDAGDIKVIAGGIIPEKDFDKLKAYGIAEIFLPGVTTAEIVNWIKENEK